MIVSLLVSLVIFSVVRMMINLNSNYFKIVGVYAVLSAIGTLVINFVFSVPMFFISCFLYFLIGFLVILILGKIADYFELNTLSFVALGIVVQMIVARIVAWLLVLILL